MGCQEQGGGLPFRVGKAEGKMKLLATPESPDPKVWCPGAHSDPQAIGSASPTAGPRSACVLTCDAWSWA